jgi:hypothetical protein
MTRVILPMLASCAVLVACGKKQEANSAVSTTPTNLVSSNANPVPATVSTTSPTSKFEGEIVVDVTNGAGPKVPASVTFDIRGDQVRYEPAAAGVRTVYGLGDRHAYAISDSKKAYAEIDTKAPTGKDKTPAQVRVERSTKQEKVAGLSCEDWTIDDGNETADVCAAKGIAFFDPAGDASSGSAEPSWARAMTMQNAFPLSVVVHDRSGKEEYRAEAFEVRWKKVDDAAFLVPAGFKKADLTPELKMASLP